MWQRDWLASPEAAEWEVDRVERGHPRYHVVAQDRVQAPPSPFEREDLEGAKVRVDEPGVTYAVLGTRPTPPPPASSRLQPAARADK